MYIFVEKFLKVLILSDFYPRNLNFSMTIDSNQIKLIKTFIEMMESDIKKFSN